MRSIAATILLLTGSLLAQKSSKPQISPFFDRLDDGPAFFVECRNTSGQALSSGAVVWREALRIDGTVVPRRSSWPMCASVKYSTSQSTLWRSNPAALEDTARMTRMTDCD